MNTPLTQNPENTQKAGCTNQLVRLSYVTDDILDAVEDEVGMGCGAWDCVPPKEIIAAAWRYSPMAEIASRHEITLMEIANAKKFDNIGGWARRKAKEALNHMPNATAQASRP
jgi:hypothetical protein